MHATFTNQSSFRRYAVLTLASLDNIMTASQYDFVYDANIRKAQERYDSLSHGIRMTALAIALTLLGVFVVMFGLFALAGLFGLAVIVALGFGIADALGFIDSASPGYRKGDRPAPEVKDETIPVDATVIQFTPEVAPPVQVAPIPAFAAATVTDAPKAKPVKKDTVKKPATKKPAAKKPATKKAAKPKVVKPMRIAADKTLAKKSDEDLIKIAKSHGLPANTRTKREVLLKRLATKREQLKTEAAG